jgi:hypothetical protein
MLNKKALAASVSAPPAVFVEDVFSTFAYPGSVGNQTITNGIDLAGEGGLIWIKARNVVDDHYLTDTVRGIGNHLRCNLTDAQIGNSLIQSVLSNGYVDSSGYGTSTNEVSWTFRKQEKFFDVVSYTGTGSNTTILHDLGSVPGMIIVKRTDTTGAWQVYHRANTANPETDYLVLNTDAATADSDTRWNDTLPTSTVFSLGTDATVNASGGTYVAYLFAHDAGGFGTAGTDNVISCGSFTTDGSGNATVSLGYEPQFALIKKTSGTGDWALLDSMRGWVNGSSDNWLKANASDAEASNDFGYPTATGFEAANLSGSATYIYMAIRRPMKVPTVGTEVFSPVAYTGNGSNRALTTGFPVDMTIISDRNNTSTLVTYKQFLADRLQGNANAFKTAGADAWGGGWGDGYFNFANNTGLNLAAAESAYLNNNTTPYVAYNFSRRPEFFDEVCYTGTGSATTFNHNLGVVPELMIVKKRSATDDWAVYAGDNTDFLLLNTTAATADDNTYWNDTSPTSTVFSVGTNADVNTSAATYVAYLFATLAGVSKVGSYTGNGGTQAIACGFTGGARFVLIKRTDSTGDWYVYDTARGMTLLTNPYLELNTTDAESATLGSVTTTTGGFTVDASILAAINTNAASYIFLAIS